MSFRGKTYPKIFPEGCPPNSSKTKKIKVYRLIQKDIITRDDFKSFKESGRDARSERYPFIEYGISVNSDYEELRRNWRGNPGLKRRFKNIGTGLTYICTGVIEPTPGKNQDNHYTWWIYQQVDPSTFFSIVGGESFEGKK